jgi:hypothetical protein
MIGCRCLWSRSGVHCEKGKYKAEGGNRKSTRSKGHGDARRADVGGYTSRHDSAACHVGQSRCVGVTGQGSARPRRPAKPPRRAPSFGEFRSLSGPQVERVTGRRRDGLPCQEGMGMWQVIGRKCAALRQRRQCARSLIATLAQLLYCHLG